jgi:hypothetical protein
LRVAFVLPLAIFGLFAWRALRDDAAPGRESSAALDSSPTRDDSAGPTASASPAEGAADTKGDGADVSSTQLLEKTDDLPQLPATDASAAGSATSSGGATPLTAALAADSQPGGKDEPSLFPKHWRRCFGSFGDLDSYEFVSDSSTVSNGSRSARIRSRNARPDPPGAALCQHIAATNYRGKRVRATLHMKSEEVPSGAHMMFRADSPSGQVVAFYNMAPGWLYGTVGWAEYSAVLDVPKNASVIVFAGRLVNTGTLWIDDASIEVVDPSTPLTDRQVPNTQFNQVVAPDQLSTSLQNGGFEETSAIPAGD